MDLDPEAITTVSVDSYSTLVDVGAAEDALKERVDNPESVSRLWRNRAVSYSLVSNFIGSYKPFYELNRDALQFSLEAHEIDLDPKVRDDILDVYHDLDVFDDVQAGLERISDAGYQIFVLSNGDPEMLNSLVEHAEIREFISDTISADEIETFKPSSRLYQHAASRMETPIEEIAHVSAGWLDVQGAIHAGMFGIWLNRTSGPWDPFDGEPDRTVRSFHDFADILTQGE